MGRVSVKICGKELEAILTSSIKTRHRKQVRDGIVKQWTERYLIVYIPVDMVDEAFYIFRKSDIEKLLEG